MVMRMKTWSWGLAVVLLAAGVVRADEAAGPKAVIDKAIKAHGGLDNLKKYAAQVAKAKGKFYGMGDGIDYTSETSFQAPNKLRILVDAGGFKFVQIVDGDKGWMDVNGEVSEMNKEFLEEARHELHAMNVSRLFPLLEDGYKLSALGEVKVDGKPAVGVKVEHKGFRDVNLFFDKDSGLLVKMERRGKDVMAGGTEYTAEELLSDYKKVDGLEVPYKVLINRDGKKFVESEVTEVKVAEKLDAKVFGKPQG
jgi:hypothetical protein